MVSVSGGVASPTTAAICTTRRWGAMGAPRPHAFRSRSALTERSRHPLAIMFGSSACRAPDPAIVTLERNPLPGSDNVFLQPKTLPF